MDSVKGESMRTQLRHFSALCESVSCDGECVRAMTVSPSLYFTLFTLHMFAPQF